MSEYDRIEIATLKRDLETVRREGLKAVLKWKENANEVARLRGERSSLQERNRSLTEALERIDGHASTNRRIREIVREALAGGGDDPEAERGVSAGGDYQPNPVYPRGLDGTDGLEDGHWAVQ